MANGTHAAKGRSTRLEQSTKRPPPSGKKPSAASETRPARSAAAGATEKAPRRQKQEQKPGARRRNLDPGGVAARVVLQAASILEEEVARGILAAQEVERRYIDVGALRSEPPDHIMQRFRRDAHDLVDILIDLVHVSARSLGNAVMLEAGSRPLLNQPRNGVKEIVTVEVPDVVAPGGQGEITLTLANSDEEETPPFSFNTLGLVSATGEEIPAECISFEPKQVVIEAEAEAELRIVVSVPEATPPGRYTGLLQATHLERLCATLSMKVGTPADD